MGFTLIAIYIPSRSLRSASERHLVVPSQRHKITLQNVFIHRSWLVEWTSHPHPGCWIPGHFQATPENSSLPSSLDFILKKKNTSLSFPLPLTVWLEFALNSAQKFVLQALPVCLPLYNASLIVYLNCKSLWIKASTKLINVNVIYT